jgi:hypothetical protein
VPLTPAPRGVERLELVLVQLTNAALLVGLKFARAGQIGHLRDFQTVLDNRLRVDNRHALRRRHEGQRRSCQSNHPGRPMEFNGRE